MAEKNKKIGILGGSFDPIHNGHLAIAESAYRDFSLDEVWFVPAGHSPNKKEADMTDAVMRAEMTELAVSDIPYFKVSRIELESEETSYTYRTMLKLKEQYPFYDFYFIMGADSLDYFDKWVHPEIICENATILVAVRDELDQNAIADKIAEIKQLFHADIFILSCGKVTVASREVRKEWENGCCDNEYVPEAVKQYIKKHGLYQG